MVAMLCNRPDMLCCAVARFPRGGIVVLSIGVAGRLHYLWNGCADDIVAELDAHECINNDTSIRAEQRSTRYLAGTDGIVGTCMW